MRKGLILSLGLVLLAVAGCKQGSGGDSTGPMKTGPETSVAPAAPAAMPATMPSAVMYTCTMHPEVVSAAPGKCPKCGMDLVVKK